MIVVDTNVISALMRTENDPAIVRWLDKQASESIWTTAITVFELRFGIERLAKGRRKRHLAEALRHVLEEDIQERVWPFDATAAQQAAVLAANRERRGRPTDLRDTMIAGIVLARRAEFATRNVRHFRDLDVPVIDPWAGD